MSNLIDQSEPLDWEWLTTPHKSPQIKWVEVSPEQCGLIVETLNPANRPIREGRVNFWQNEMNLDKWKFTHQGTAFTVVETTDGDHLVQVQDGQHRFLAAHREGYSLSCLMAVGMPNANFGVIDVGAIRTGSDTLAVFAASHSELGDIFRNVNRNVHNSAVRLVKVVDLYRGEARNAFGRFKIHNIDIPDLVLEYGVTLAEFVTSAEIIRKKRETPGMSSGALAAAMYLINRTLETEDDKLKFKEFLRGYSEGTMLHTGDSRVPLRTFMQNLKDSHGRRVPAIIQLGIFIKAWNRWVEGKAVQVLVFRSDEMFPLPDKPGYGTTNEFMEGVFTPIT